MGQTGDRTYCLPIKLILVVFLFIKNTYSIFDEHILCFTDSCISCGPRPTALTVVTILLATVLARCFDVFGFAALL